MGLLAAYIHVQLNANARENRAWEPSLGVGDSGPDV